MSKENNYFRPEIKFEHSWKNITKEDIMEVVVHTFPGIEDFISFYLKTNGGIFQNGEYKNSAFFYADKFYKDFNTEYSSLEISSFYCIQPLKLNKKSEYLSDIQTVLDRRILISEELEDFCDFHIPFANDHADNDFWIDIQTGEIKYIDYGEMLYDPEKAITIAPSFKDFCENLVANRRK